MGTIQKWDSTIDSLCKTTKVMKPGTEILDNVGE